MSSEWRSTEMPGVFEIGRPELADERGSFNKILGEGDCGSEAPFRTREVFWSRSRRGTLRGLHVQLPPRATRKLVFVVSGEVRDFILDLRVGSPTHGVVLEFQLDASGGGLIIPEGCAHGFEAVSDDAAMVYGQEDYHSPDHDGGVLFTSAGIVLRTSSPIVSARDLQLPALADFDSPFVFT